ncbi:MAG: hypothetical protein ACI83O_000785 [Patescibacteria group bacterium]|jgi:hypothetical protein
MERNIYFVTFIFLISFSSAGTFYQIDLSYTSSEFTIDSVDVTFDRGMGNRYGSSVSLQENLYGVRLLNYQGSILFSNQYLLPTAYIIESGAGSDSIHDGSIETVNSVDFTLLLPYNSEASSLGIYDQDGGLLANYSLALFTAKSETNSTGVVIDTDASSSDTPVKSSTTYLIVILLLIILAFVIYVFTRRLGK